MGEGKNQKGNKELVFGASLSTYAAASTIITGTVCPLCVIASPILLGIGVYKKIKNRKLTAK